MSLQYIYIIFLPHDVKCTTLLQQSTPTTWCCHPSASRLGWCYSGCMHLPFSSKHNNWNYACGHCPFGRPLCDQDLTSWLMSWDISSIHPHNCPTSWCHLFCEVHQSLLQQSTPKTWCCNPRASRLGWCSSACKPPLSSKRNDGHDAAKQFYFVSSDNRTFLQKVQALSPCAIRSQFFLWWFWNSGVFLAEWPFRLCRYRTCFTVDIDAFVPVSSSIFTRSFAVVLGLIFTFRTKVCSSLGDRMRLLPERYDGCVVPWC